ncbi:helix-turn-helix domain-containing protein [uncultured Flavonifractor sp.]|uniref:helix-turn-helix domain-containing protein n=1 Tax=uncultured Flavonifractor sp. TaxID=1193534 RepID=UPI0026161613|nr:helix-turn-helix transcriptional regulator [uncultured Flavonifractor sp.]
MEMRIRTLRKRVGMTQAELAERIGLKSSSAVTMWESGERHPRSSLVPKLAEVLGCTVGELYGERSGRDGKGA